MIGHTLRKTEITTLYLHNKLGFVEKIQSIYLGYVETIIYFTFINIIMKRETSEKQDRVQKNNE